MYRRSAPRFIFGFVLMMALVMAAAVMWLWNAILPDVLGVKSITYLQALGLLALSRILFGNYGWQKGGKPHMPHKRAWRDKWMHLTPEEKIRMREAWRERCQKKGDAN
ncbi:MAG TPA: hypothetical protein PKA00_19245 [Saprospiraceae bacterium]|nr:hypothetical protein [Saprospiraceae bacterium]HMQ85054.1 hypothetical protein [Saprospiraceae bacterium]